MLYRLAVTLISLLALANAAFARTPLESAKLRSKAFIESTRQSDSAYHQLEQAIKQPEYVLNNHIRMPVSPDMKATKPFYLSLRDAIFLALRYNPDLQSSELDRVVARYQLRLQQNQFEPQYALDGGANKSWPSATAINDTSLDNANVNATISLNNHLGGKTTLATNNQYNGNEYQPSVTLSLEQPLLRGAGKDMADRNLHDQKDSEKQSKMALKQAVIDKVTAVIEAYRAMIQQNNALKTQRQSLKDAIKTYQQNETRIAAGRLPPSANTQQSFQIAQIKTTLEGQENSRLQASQHLLTTIGLDPDMTIMVPENIHIDKLIIPDEKKSLAYALAHNTNYQNALLEAKKTYRSYLASKNAQHMQLDLTASTRFGEQNGLTGKPFNAFFNGRNSEQRVGLKFSVPINDLGRREQLISAKLTLEKTRLRLTALKRQLKTDIFNTIRSIRTQAHLYELSQKQLAFAKKSYQLELKKQEAGISSSLDVTNSQDQLIRATNNVMSVKITYLNLMSQLQQKLTTTLDVWHLNIGFLSI